MAKMSLVSEEEALLSALQAKIMLFNGLAQLRKDPVMGMLHDSGKKQYQKIESC